jgi:hypothetical protein
MGRSPALVREPGVNTDAAVEWSREIRDYLLGRLAAGHQSMSLTARQTQQLRHAPIRRWWIFEGKRYGSVDGNLASRWVEIIRATRLLERTFNPRLKLSERPDGAIDWGHTLARGFFGPHPEYVVRSSVVGLGAEEYAALQGWMQWISEEWAQYGGRFGLTLPAAAQEALDMLAAQERETHATVEQLRRWLHVARRSRWPLLRDVVAETLRTLFEPAALDRIPLPTDRATLFELLCLVRIARHVAPPPDELRWLDFELNENELRLEGTTCSYQRTLDRDAVLSTPDFEQGLAEVVPVFGLSLPRRVDLAFDFDSPRCGIDGVLVEAKSGNQGFDAAVAQLRVYRRARPTRVGTRHLVWGIVEQSEGGAISEPQIDWLKRKIDSQEGDVWVFSTADSIPAVLGLLGCPAEAVSA